MLRILRHLAWEGPRHRGDHHPRPAPAVLSLPRRLTDMEASDLAAAWRALQPTHRPTILQDRCVQPDTTPTTTGPAAATTPAPPTSRATPARGTSALTCPFPSRRATPARANLGGTS